MASLTGAVVSKIVTETYNGKFKFDRNKFLSIMAHTCLTVRNTIRAEMKVGHSEPIVYNGVAIVQGIKGTLGITG